MIHRVLPAGRWFEGGAPARRAGGWVLALGGLAIVMAGLAFLGKSKVPGGLGTLLLVVVLGAIIIRACLRHPPIAVVFLLGTMFLRLALPHLIVADPFLIAWALVLVSAAGWMWQRRGTLPPVTFVEVVMGLYVLWSYCSMVLPHQYKALTYPLNGSVTKVPRFIETSTDIPFTMYLLGRRLFARESAVRLVLWSAVGFAAYSTLVSIDQFDAPSLVWPRYIVNAPAWPDRANGVFNQPVANGMVLIIGLIVAIMLATDQAEPAWRRCLLWVYVVPSAYAVYLTHTRAIWLAFVLVLVFGAILASGARAVFVGLLGTIALIVALNWSTFTSSDRAAGGVDSKSEVWDRLNAIATSIWAFKREPWFGWGISRFVAVNTFHHQQWNNDIPWVRGLGIPAHETELGILVDLGLLGLVLWLAIIVALIFLLLQAYWILPSNGLAGRRMAFIAISALTTQIAAGAFADLRLLDFPVCLVFLICGIAVGARDRERTARKPKPPLWLSTAIPARPEPMARRPEPVPVGAP